MKGPGGLVATERHAGSQVSRSHGVSIYVPMGATSVAYDRLEFAAATRWDELLQAYSS